MKKLPASVSANMITFVSGTAGPSHTTHCLAKGNRPVVVQTSFSSTSCILPQPSADDDLSPDVLLESSRAVYRTLETIVGIPLSFDYPRLVRVEAHRVFLFFQQTLLNAIDFEGTNNWAFINQTANGGFSITPRRKNFRHCITCPTWAPLIPDSHLDIRRWNVNGHADGYYNGEPVGKTPTCKLRRHCEVTPIPQKSGTAGTKLICGRSTDACMPPVTCETQILFRMSRVTSWIASVTWLDSL